MDFSKDGEDYLVIELVEYQAMLEKLTKHKSSLYFSLSMLCIWFGSNAFAARPVLAAIASIASILFLFNSGYWWSKRAHRFLAWAEEIAQYDFMPVEEDVFNDLLIAIRYRDPDRLTEAFWRIKQFPELMQLSFVTDVRKYGRQTISLHSRRVAHESSGHPTDPATSSSGGEHIGD